MDVIIKQLTPELSDDYFDFFENRAFTDDSPYRCYCQIYQMSNEQETLSCTINPADAGCIAKDIAAQQIHSGVLQGYLAYVNDKAIGWCNANDKSAYTVLSRDIKEAFAPKETHEKAVVCFEIAPDYRGKGIATALLQRVIDDAKKQGYAVIDSFPDVRTERYEWDCKGPLHLYEKAGFYKVTTHDTYSVMRKELK